MLDERKTVMALQDALAKLSLDDKLEILRHIVILPMIEVDKSMSQEELGDALLSGKKLGFPDKKVKAEIDALVKSVGAVIEDE